jgi:hypothetical protein
MAQRQSTQLLDDLDGTSASRTVKFAINEHHYEMDLSTANLVGFQRALSRYLTVARPDGPGAQQQRRLFPVEAPTTQDLTPAPVPAPKVLPDPTFDGSDADIRLWAQHKRMVVRPRARIPREIEHAYSAAAKRRASPRTEL